MCKIIGIGKCSGDPALSFCLCLSLSFSFFLLFF
jgi:hypothetical protein